MRKPWYGTRVRLVAMFLGSVALCLLAVRFRSVWQGQSDLWIYFRSVQTWESGHSLYDYSQPDSVMTNLGFTYPPVAGVFMLPMTWVSFRWARLLTVGAITLAAALIIALAVWVLLPARRRPLWTRGLRLDTTDRLRWSRGEFAGTVAVLTPLALATEPWWQNISFGQINLFLGVLVMIDVVLVIRRPDWAGFGIGLATAIKLTPGIFLLYALVTGQRKLFRNGLVGAITTTLVGAVILPGETWHYFTANLWDARKVGDPSYYQNQSLRGLFSRLFPTAPNLTTVVWVLSAATVLVIGLRAARTLQRSDGSLGAFAVVGMVGVLIAPVSWVHHNVWAVPMMMALAVAGYRAVRRADLTRATRALPIVLFVVGAGILYGRPEAPFSRVDWTEAGPVSAILSSLQMMWCLSCVLLAGRWWITRSSTTTPDSSQVRWRTRLSLEDGSSYLRSGENGLITPRRDDR